MLREVHYLDAARHQPATHTAADFLARWAVELVGAQEDVSSRAWERPGARPAHVPVAACFLQYDHKPATTQLVTFTPVSGCLQAC
jgi:hypothetical protein